MTSRRSRQDVLSDVSCEIPGIRAVNAFFRRVKRVLSDRKRRKRPASAPTSRPVGKEVNVRLLDFDLVSAAGELLTATPQGSQDVF